MLINFTEIPITHSENGLKDSFELFSRDLLESLGFIIVTEPNRGPDGKKDLIVKEIRKGTKGITNDSEIFWLVSCKHYANSGKAVSDNDEPDLTDRLIANNCSGFIGFYSTILSSGLANKIELLKTKFQIQTFDRERIEKIIVGNPEHQHLFQRYFPKSYTKWKEIDNHLEPVKLFDYFIDKNYNSFRSFFKDVFGDTATLIKSLRTSQSLKDLLLSQKYQLFKEEVLEEMMTLSINDIKGEKGDQTTMVDVFTTIIPKRFKNVDFNEIRNSFLGFSMISICPKWHDELNHEELKPEAIYYIYSGYLFVNNSAEQVFEKLFSKLKSIID